MYVRNGRENLDKEIEAIFGAEDKNPDGTEKFIIFGEYVEKLNRRALIEWQEKRDKIRTGTFINFPENEDINPRPASEFPELIGGNSG